MYWQEIFNWNSAKFEANLEHIFNFTEMQINLSDIFYHKLQPQYVDGVTSGECDC